MILFAVVEDVVLQQKQILVLLWKHAAQAGNHWITTIVRLGIPTIVLLTLWIVNRITYDYLALGEGDFHLKAKPIPRVPQGKILFAPLINETHMLMTIFAKNNDPPLTIDPLGSLSCNSEICGVRFTHQMSDMFENSEQEYVGGIDFSFDEKKEVNKTLKYNLWFNGTVINRNPLIPFDPISISPRDFSLSFQRGIEEAILESALHKSIKIEVGHKPFPVINNEFTNLRKEIVFNLCDLVFYFVGFFLCTVLTHYAVNSERNEHLRLLMQHHNLKDISYWCAWLTWSSVINFLACVIMIVFGKILGIILFTHTNFFVLLIVFFVTSMSLTATVLLLSTCVRGNVITNTISFLSLLGHLSFVIIFLIYASDSVSIGTIVSGVSGAGILKAFPAFNYGKSMTDISHKAKQISSLPDQYGNVNFTDSYFYFSDMFNHVWNCTTDMPIGLSQNDDCITYTFINVLYISAYTLVVMILVILFDACLPRVGQPGRKRWWGRKKDALNVDVGLWDSGRFSSVLPDTDVDIVREYQYVTSNLSNPTLALKIIKLSKMYPKKWYRRGDVSKNALDNVTMGADSGTVFVLLGHNGAGKSTLINILTGMNTTSSGDVLIDQKSVVNELGDIRKNMGICQQDDILFPELTGEQHLWLLGSIRGIPRRELKEAIEQKLKLLKLYKFKDNIAATYSGGMKRRLGVAMAILGNPKILLLDEPTSGMDPVGKRLIWNMIRKLRKDRIILLSTHSMEEADSVGDKIAILALGRLRAIGTPMHLKQRFGMGYSVNLTTTEERKQSLKQKILQIFKTTDDEKNMLLAGLQLSTETNTQLSYTIFRTSYEQMKMVTSFFLYLESGHSLVDDFVVSHTTLEDVFLRLTHGDGLVIDDSKPSWDNEQIILELRQLVRQHEDTIVQFNQEVQTLKDQLQRKEASEQIQLE